MGTGRRREIDICKGILTVTMILCHCIQFFGNETEGVQKILADVINLATFSGFLFCFGYVSDIAYYRKEWKESAGKMLKNAVGGVLYFGYRLCGVCGTEDISLGFYYRSFIFGEIPWMV